MNIEDALPTFTSIIAEDARHEHYERTVEVAKFAYRTSTGDDMNELITSVRKRENAAQKKQRVSITKPLAPVSTEMVKKYFRKLRKTDGVKMLLRWTNERSAAKEQLESALSMFYAQQSAEEYLFDVLEDYTFLDPNAFLVIERENVIDANGRLSGVKVYPVEWPAENIRHYNYRHGALDYLLIEEVLTEKQRGVERDVSEFRMYGAGWVMHVVEYIEQRPEIMGTVGEYQDIAIANEQTGKTRNFVYYIYQNGTEEVPAIRLGAYLDGQTMSATAVTPMEPVKPLIEQLINIGSLHDLTTFLHSIPRRKELVETCDYHDPDTGRACEYGWIDSETTCPKCKGTGDKSISSEQDMIRITLPPNFRPEDIPDLAKMAHTEEADVNLLRWHQEKIDWLMKFIVYATMTRDAVTMAEVSRTATEMQLNAQDAYDKIQPYAELYSQAFTLIARIATQYQETAEGFMASHRFPDDYQFETEDQLLEKLEKARTTRAPYEYIAHLQRQLIRRQTRSTEEAERAKAWDKWKPWPDLTDEMLAVVLADRDPRDPDRLLRENFFRIRTEIEQQTDGLFYLLTYERQGELISEKIEELAGMIRFRAADPVDFDIENPMG